MELIKPEKCTDYRVNKHELYLTHYMCVDKDKCSDCVFTQNINNWELIEKVCKLNVTTSE